MTIDSMILRIYKPFLKKYMCIRWYGDAKSVSISDFSRTIKNEINMVNRKNRGRIVSGD